MPSSDPDNVTPAPADGTENKPVNEKTWTESHTRRTFYIDKTVLERLKRYAAANDRSISAVANAAIENYLSQNDS